VQELSDEWTAGALRQGGTRGPPVKALEEHYGPGVRNGKPNRGSSYRSTRYRKSRTEDNHFAKRKRVYDIIDAEGAEGVTRLQGLIDAKFGTVGAGVSPREDHVQWLFKKLTQDDPSYEKHKERAIEGAHKRRKT
jgi:hypothetical protein